MVLRVQKEKYLIKLNLYIPACIYHLYDSKNVFIFEWLSLYKKIQEKCLLVIRLQLPNIPICKSKILSGTNGMVFAHVTQMQTEDFPTAITSIIDILTYVTGFSSMPILLFYPHVYDSYYVSSCEHNCFVNDARRTMTSFVSQPSPPIRDMIAFFPSIFFFIYFLSHPFSITMRFLSLFLSLSKERRRKV